MNDEWRTPTSFLDFFSEWDDPCQFGQTDGLTREWQDPTYVNPPYSDPLPWVRKALSEAKAGKRVAMLLKHDSSTEWWRLLHEGDAFFLPIIGRLRFSDGKTPANFPSVLVLIPRKSTKETKGG